MAERTEEQILDQIVYAVYRAASHYGPELSEDGLIELRKVLANFYHWRTDSGYRVDVQEDDAKVDFCPGVLPDDTKYKWTTLDYITRASKGQLVEGIDYLRG